MDERDLLVRCQEFIGKETSMESKTPRAVAGWYEYPRSEAALLRLRADKEERKDQLILDIRTFLTELAP